MGQQKLFYLFVFTFIISLSFKGQASQEFKKSELEGIIKSGLNFIIHSQAQKDDDLFFKGDFPSIMKLEHLFPGLGFKGKKAFDSNVFTTSLVTNSLLSLYHKDPSTYGYLLPSIELGIENILPYREGDAFAFWRVQTVERHFKNNPFLKNIPIRRANNFRMHTPLIYLAQNVPVDSDDTQSAMASLILYKRLFEGGKTKVDFDIPEKIGPLFSAYRDQKRKQFNPFNWRHGDRRFMKKTKAFMTWFVDETHSPFASIPRRNKPYMPLGFNDVDCVVNANILSTLGMSGEIQDTVGVEDSCKFLKGLLDKKKEKSCAMYYPNHLQWAHSFMKAYDDGAICLESHLKVMEERLIEQQRPDGSFESYNGDYLYSTALAFSGMVKFPNPSPALKEATQRSLDYLLQHKKKDKKGNIYWPSGVFFSGGTIVRRTVIWESDAYTTAIVVEALDRYLRNL